MPIPTVVTTLSFEEGVDEWTVRYRDGSTAVNITDVVNIDFQGHGIMVEDATHRYLIPWSSVIYVHQSI
jgi:hypothetical protein